MGRLPAILIGVMAAALLAGCSAGGAGYKTHHHHKHKHQYMTKDYGYPTYQKQIKRDTHLHKHHRTYNHHGKRVSHYPYSYYGSKHAAHTRMSRDYKYGQGYEAGCRTATSGSMYKNPKLLSNSQHYQMGWETGFNQCHFDKTHMHDRNRKYSYIPY